MKLISYLINKRQQLGLLIEDRVFGLRSLNPVLPETMEEMLTDWDHHFLMAFRAERKLKEDRFMQMTGIPVGDLNLIAPVPKPSSLRDGYAFRQHVETARRNRGLSMTEVFYEYPVFYFGNHLSVTGPGEIVCMPDHFEKLDYELEVGIVISKKGRNIKASEADEYIAGLMILNDFSARTLQMEEMLLNLGPAKGKDFVTATGPWLVTPDELNAFEVPGKKDHVGKSWNLPMTAKVNGSLLSEGNLSDMDWTFAELIERASYGVDLYPGDIIGSGTVGTGCLLELNGTAKLKNPDYKETWLQPGYEIQLTVEGLGTLSNTIARDISDFSILKKKKRRLNKE
jgi:fumarylacetoacetate (FAA) hydrolase